MAKTLLDKPEKSVVVASHPIDPTSSDDHKPVAVASPTKGKKLLPKKSPKGKKEKRPPTNCILVYPFKCNLCLFRTTSEALLTQHCADRHENNSQHVSCCLNCALEFDSYLSFSLHMTNVHRNDRPQVTASMAPLAEAMAEAMPEQNLYNCDLCHFTTKFQGVMNLHLFNSHKDKSEMPKKRKREEEHEEELPAKVSPTQASLIPPQPILEVPKPDPRPKCRFNCLYRNESKEEVTKHELLHHAKDREMVLQYRAREKSKIPCYYCPDHVPQAEMKAHQKKYHSEHLKTGLFPCRVCDFSTKDVDELDKHRTILHGCEPFAGWPEEQEEDYPETDEEDIDFSDYVFNQIKNGLINYSAMGPKFDESGRRFLYCQLCDFKDVVPGRLTKHKKTEHPDPPTLPCIECGYLCYCHSHLVGHMREKHDRPSFALNRRWINREMFKQKQREEEEMQRARMNGGATTVPALS